MPVAFQRMTPEQREHVDALQAAWPGYASLLSRKSGVIGGMQWKRVAGNEYLTRYWQDAGSGKKVARSLGRRSPETEAIFAAFEAERAEVREGLEEAGPRIDMLGRLAKALRLARMPSRVARGIHRLWAADLMVTGGPLAALGVAAVCAYELRYSVFAPSFSVRSEDVILFWRPRGEPFDAQEVAEVFLGESPVYVEERARGAVVAFRSSGGFEVMISSSDRCALVLEDLDVSRAGLGMIRKSLAEPCVALASVARDATVVGVNAVSPWAHVLVAPLLDGLAAPDASTPGRGHLIAAMVNEFGEGLPSMVADVAAEVSEAIVREKTLRI